MFRDVMADPAGVAIRATTKRREWWGWMGAMSWLFFMMYGFDTFTFAKKTVEYDLYQVNSLVGRNGGLPVPFFFMAACALSIAVLGWVFGRDPVKLSRLAFVTTPLAVIATAVFAFLPQIPGTVLYILSGVLFAPALARRVYGVLHTSGSSGRITRYMGGIAGGIAMFTIGMVAWVSLDLPGELVFLIPALLAVPAWTGISLTPPPAVAGPEKKAIGISKAYTFILVAAMAITVFFSISLSSVMHSRVVYSGMSQNIAAMTLGFLLPAIAFIAYGIIHDSGFERLGFIFGMGLYLLGILFALVPGENLGGMPLFLAFSEGFGGSYSEYFILTVPVFLFVGAKRPVFAAGLGIVANLTSSAILWVAGKWLPDTLLTPGAPLYTTAAISTVVLIVLVYFVFEQYRERTLASALFVMLRGKGESIAGQADHAGHAGPAKPGQPALVVYAAPGTSQAAPKDPAFIAGLSKEEIEVALLLVEGASRSDITRRLRLTAAELDGRLKSIRQKVGGDSYHPDPVISTAAMRFKLTKREADMLGCLRSGMTNVEIAAGLYLSESTVKNHVHSLMKKLPVEGRLGIPEWLFALEHEKIPV